MTYMPAQALLKTLIETADQFKRTMTADTISFDLATHTIADSAGGLAWLEIGDVVTVAGSTDNDGAYTVTTAGAASVVVSEDLANEIAGADVTLSREAHVTEGDLRILDRGYTYLCILFPGPVGEYDTASMTREQFWTGYADLFVKFSDDTAYSAFGTLRDAVIAAVNAAPCLSATYFVTAISAQDDPGEVYDKLGGGPYFIWQRLRIAIQENI